MLPRDQVDIIDEVTLIFSEMHDGEFAVFQNPAFSGLAPELVAMMKQTMKPAQDIDLPSCTVGSVSTLCI